MCCGQLKRFLANHVDSPEFIDKRSIENTVASSRYRRRNLDWFHVHPHSIEHSADVIHVGVNAVIHDHEVIGEALVHDNLLAHFSSHVGNIDAFGGKQVNTNSLERVLRLEERFGIFLIKLVKRILVAVADHRQLGNVDASPSSRTQGLSEGLDKLLGHSVLHSSNELRRSIALVDVQFRYGVFLERFAHFLPLTLVFERVLIQRKRDYAVLRILETDLVVRDEYVARVMIFLEFELDRRDSLDHFDRIGIDHVAIRVKWLAQLCRGQKMHGLAVDLAANGLDN